MLLQALFGSIIKRWSRKPVSVLICHLSSRPTPWHRAGSPHLPVYLVLQALAPYPGGVTDARRELLPHVFTLAVTGGHSLLRRA